MESKPIESKKIIENKEKLSLNVLVADDEPKLRELFKDTFEAFGHTVEVVENGNLLIQKLSEPGASFDMIFSDNTMPGKTGSQALREIRAGGNNIPFILATTDTGTIQEDAEKLGAVFMSKPVKLSELKKEIEKIKEKIREQRKKKKEDPESNN